MDFLKIDREFIRDVRTGVADQHVIRAIVGLARGFGLKTIAEGVEDQATLDLLRDLSTTPRASSSAARAVGDRGAALAAAGQVASPMR